MRSDKYTNRENVKTIAKIALAILITYIVWRLELILVNLIPLGESLGSGIGLGITTIAMVVIAIVVGAGLGSYIVKRVSAKLE